LFDNINCLGLIVKKIIKGDLLKMEKLTFGEKYNAIGKKDFSYEGVFVTAVKTTGIFCRPSCRARKPKLENVVFYDTAQEALQNRWLHLIYRKERDS